jgi:gliding motility-associated-like protein
MKKTLLLFAILCCSAIFLQAQPFGCDVNAIRTAFTNAGYQELPGVQGQPCSMYFINPTSQDANLSEADAQQLGAHLVVFNDAAENAAVVAALNSSGVIANVGAVWVGYTDNQTEGTWVTLDGSPMSYLNWASNEPNNNGQGSSCCGIPDFLGGCQTDEAWRCQYGEDCAQIYSSGTWNDLPCNRASVSVIEVNLCPQITTTVPANPVCANYRTYASATTILGSQPYGYVWNELPGGTQIATTAAISVTPTGTTSYQVQVTDRYGCYALDTAVITAQVCIGPPGCDLTAMRNAFAAAGYNELNGVVGQSCSLYFINPQSQDANQSEQDARQLGAHLVVFNDAAENTAVVNALNSSGVIASVGAVWVGYTDVASEGNWVTLDGTPMAYLNWAGGEPNNNGQGDACCSFPDWLGGCQSSDAFQCANGEDCMQIYAGGTWNDLPCDRSSVSVIEINLCPTITANADVVQCAGAPIALNATTLLGSTPYTYTWNPGNSSANPTTVNPAVSTLYTVTVTDRWGCFDDDTVSVTINGGGIQSFVVYPNPVCINRATTITYTGTNTPGPGVTFTWGFNGGTVVSGSGAGPYEVLWTTGGTKTVTLDVNDNGCISQQISQQVTINNNPVADAGADVTVCSGGIVQLGTAATGGYEYKWYPSNNLSNDSISNPVFSAVNLTPTPVTVAYAVAVTQFACYNTDTVNITINPPSATGITAQGNIPVCAGGSVVLAADSVYVSYLWSDTTFNNSVTVSAPGSYYMAAVAANGCQYISNTINVTFNPPSASSISALGATSFCEGGNVTLSSDSVYVSYLWSENSNTSTINVTQTGNYTMSGIDAAGCQFASNTIAVTANPNPVIALTNSTDETCFGAGDGTITVSANTGTPAYNYAWNTNPQQFTATATSLSIGNYDVTVYDANQCSGTANYSIATPAVLALNVNTITNASCFETTDGSVTIDVTGGTAPYNYAWSNASTASSLQNAGAGTYDVTVADANQCSVTSSFVITEPAETTVQSLVFDNIKFGTEVQLNLDVLPSTGTYTYQWSPANYLSCTNCSNPTFSGIRSLDYEITVTDADGCTVSATVQVKVKPDKPFFVPNVFTPNGDNQNDVLQIFATGTVYFHFSVFNRWGEKVFETNNVNDGWDGKYQGKDAFAGVYTYVIELNFLDSERRKYIGSFTLLR